MVDVNSLITTPLDLALEIWLICTLSSASTPSFSLGVNTTSFVLSTAGNSISAADLELSATKVVTAATLVSTALVVSPASLELSAASFELSAGSVVSVAGLSKVVSDQTSPKHLHPSPSYFDSPPFWLHHLFV